jgi:hypothetical protein
MSSRAYSAGAVALSPATGPAGYTATRGPGSATPAPIWHLGLLGALLACEAVRWAAQWRRPPGRPRRYRRRHLFDPWHDYPTAQFHTRLRFFGGTD